MYYDYDDLEDIAPANMKNKNTIISKDCKNLIEELANELEILAGAQYPNYMRYRYPGLKERHIESMKLVDRARKMIKSS